MATKVRSPNYKELQRILRKELGKPISEKEARKIGRWLLNLYSHLLTK